MKESLYFSSCDAASNLGCYWYISELKKCVQLKLEMNIIGVVNLHEVSVTTSKKINKTKSLNKFKKKDLILFSQFTNIGPKTDQVNQISETILSA